MLYSLKDSIANENVTLGCTGEDGVTKLLLFKSGCEKLDEFVELGADIVVALVKL